MQSNEYIEGASRTNSNRYDVSHVDPRTIHSAFSLFIAAGKAMDAVKRALYYGKTLNHGKFQEAMNEADDAIRTHQRRHDPADIALVGYSETAPLVDGQIVHAAVGLATESAEIVEAVLKGLASGEFDFGNFSEEIQDCQWYTALGLKTASQNDPASVYNGGDTEWTYENIWDANIAKLRARYPEQFTTELAHNRDLEKEKKAMEG